MHQLLVRFWLHFLRSQIFVTPCQRLQKYCNWSKDIEKLQFRKLQRFGDRFIILKTESCKKNLISKTWQSFLRYRRILYFFNYRYFFPNTKKLILLLLRGYRVLLSYRQSLLVTKAQYICSGASRGPSHSPVKLKRSRHRTVISIYKALPGNESQCWDKKSRSRGCTKLYI